MSYDNVQMALRRYNVIAGHTYAWEIPAQWIGMAERLITASLCNMLRGDSLQFVVDRVNDCFVRAGSTERWTPPRNLGCN